MEAGWKLNSLASKEGYFVKKVNLSKLIGKSRLVLSLSQARRSFLMCPVKINGTLVDKSNGLETEVDVSVGDVVQLTQSSSFTVTEEILKQC